MLIVVDVWNRPCVNLETMADSQKKLLLVDDDPTTLALLSAVFLADSRIEVHTADTGVGAMELAAEIGPHLVLLDITLPDREGYAVCRFIKYHPNCGRTKVVFLSGLAEQANWNTWEKVGADGFLSKPFQVAEINEYVLNILNLTAEKAA
jgi:two-component system, OmpR family, response regulator